MNALAIIQEEDPVVPAGEQSLDAETFQFLRNTITRMQRSLRQPLPVPREGVEAGLTLMLCAVNERLGNPIDGEFPFTSAV